MSVLDPSKDKLAYFKDNIQTAEDQEDFDASQYYYNRQEGFFKAGQSAMAGNDGLSSGAGLSMPPGAFGSFGSSGSQSGGMNSFLAATTTGLGMGSIGMSSMGMGGGVGMGMGMATSSTTNNVLRPTPAAPSSGGLPPHEMNYMARTLSTESSPAAPKPHRQIFSEKGPDMSEFPALTSRSLSLDVDSSSSSFRQNSEFVIQKEDFPALSAFGGAPQPLNNEKAMSTTNDAMLQRHQPTNNANNASIGSRSGGASTNFSQGNFHASNMNSFPTLSDAKQGGAVSGRKADEYPKFGLIGMLQFMRPNESERALVHGYDLTSLGMNLNSSESLHQTFASPWADGPSTQEPQYNLPACYYNQPPVLKTAHLSKFQLETLFFVFYAMPKDVVQAYAAQELYIREWRYHGELKLWFKRQPNEGSGVAQFIYFDINSWERRLFGGNTNGISAGFMGEDDIRVKFNGTSNA